MPQPAGVSLVSTLSHTVPPGSYAGRQTEDYILSRQNRKPRYDFSALYRPQATPAFVAAQPEPAAVPVHWQGRTWPLAGNLAMPQRVLPAGGSRIFVPPFSMQTAQGRCLLDEHALNSGDAKRIAEGYAQPCSRVAEAGAQQSRDEIEAFYRDFFAKASPFCVRESVVSCGGNTIVVSCTAEYREVETGQWVVAKSTDTLTYTGDGQLWQRSVGTPAVTKIEESERKLGIPLGDYSTGSKS
eukprot:TRINITY_DN9919_c0_g1_i1.p1 TRINITY_DN9919_c0_g1~~TRINITY_DN9919_c0_g1_i1.p1  ORF type:complete len:254 (-),score=53.84 TRINITY_DN9919_c0_g1_i1:45-767(-)